ncbi:hypothetical protein [Ewingella americana]|uniref:hypothetical protein n=1 Tax=Ewingella americana TaxID=41202 RepID=UPI001639D0DE|nr:hypothetical protein [Ewingella americana]QMV51169.1 hypothetical protein GXP68_07200 [Ewingella americana]
MKGTRKGPFFLPFGKGRKLSFKVKVVRCRHTAKTLRCHANWPRRRVSARPLDTRAFYCWKIEAAQGWNGHVSAATVFAAKRRRLGGSRISGFEPLVSNHSFGVTSERDLLAFTPNLSIKLFKNLKTSETARPRCSKPQSKMALSERFETQGSNPVAKVPPKRRHFAV